jgi:hypothetical protein
MAHLARPDHLIGLLRGWNERLLHVDMATVFGRSDGHLSMLINPARSNGNNLQSLFVEHLAVVCVRHCSFRTFLGIATSGFMPSAIATTSVSGISAQTESIPCP